MSASGLPAPSIAIPLDDPRWFDLESLYGHSCLGILEMLQTAYAAELTTDLLDSIIDEIMHQGDPSQAMYAVAPHLLELSRFHHGETALLLMAHAGAIHSLSQCDPSVPCPGPVMKEFEASARLGAALVCRHLPEAAKFEDFQNLPSALAGFLGHGRFGRLLGGFDLYEGKFYHLAFDQPFDL